MKILVITGGVSSERKISLISANAVKNALLKNGHSVTFFDFKKGISNLKSLLGNFDVVFPVMHGQEGEDGTLYRFLKKNKIPYVGSDPKGAKIAFDKILFKKYCERHDIPTAKWKAVRTSKNISQFGFPCILKGAYGGSSHEVLFLRSAKDLNKKSLITLLNSRNKFFVESLLDGIEITVGVLGNMALPVIEIIPPKDSWFDYKNKYSGVTKELLFAPSISSLLQKKVQKMALRIHKDLDLGSFSRLDIIVKDGIPYVLEINTPGGVGLTAESLFPKAAKAVGLSFDDMIEKILRYKK